MVSLDATSTCEHPSVMASAAVKQVIALASQLSEQERRQVVDAIEPQESIAELADLWQAEIERRAARVRSGASTGSPAAEVFARVEAKLKQR
jgi:putative addiction module component (TIGR02574 family)